jgi:alkaline phosphatase D
MTKSPRLLIRRSMQLPGIGSLVVLLLTARGQDRVTLPEKLTGPMVGCVTPTEATIWAYAGPGVELVLRYGPGEKTPNPLKLALMIPKAEDHDAAKVTLTDLEPSTAYRYEVYLNGKTDPVWQGRFTTAPPAGHAARFKMAVSSCMDMGKTPTQPSWYLLLAERPAFQLLLGDNVYANTTDREGLWRFHRQQRHVVEFAAVLRNVPTYAMWDDHDYGPNNSDGTAPGKENSLRAFHELFANPAAGTETTPGAFYRFAWGDVDFFMLDGRYHRSPDNAPNDDKKRMLGDGQFEWLVDGLKSSRAKFKVLASGSTLYQSRDDGWRIYDFERKRLYQAIMGSKIGGVMYLSGDIHRCMVDVRPEGETGGYPLVEVISSGIANSKTQGFATLEFDTTVADPTVRIQIIHGDATTRLDRTLRLSEMQVK